MSAATTGPGPVLPPPDAASVVDTPPPHASTPAPHRRRRRGRLLATAAVVLVVIVGGVVGVAGTRSRTAAPSKPVAVPASAVDETVIQDRYGVRIDRIALTALGGLVQLRFTVLDVDKAMTLFHDDIDKPTIVVQPSGELLNLPKSYHKMTLLNGASYFMLYANAGNVVRGGTTVSLAIGDVRLDGLVVQK